MNAPVLSLRGIHMDYGHHPVLNDVELTLIKATCTLLTGKNGSGKTTLLKIMAGLLRPQHAEIIFPSATLSWPAAKRELHHQVIYVHQRPYLFNTSVRANIEYGLRQMGHDQSSRRQIANDALAWAALEHLADRHANQLSSGERQLIALTRAQVLAPRVLLLDEPIANLDSEAREQICFLIRRLRSMGVAIVLTSHDPHPIEPLADYHWDLHSGALSARNVAQEPNPSLNLDPRGSALSDHHSNGPQTTESTTTGNETPAKFYAGRQ